MKKDIRCHSRYVQNNHCEKERERKKGKKEEKEEHTLELRRFRVRNCFGRIRKNGENSSIELVSVMSLKRDGQQQQKGITCDLK